MYSSKIFLDSGNPQDTKLAKSNYPNLDGQTTNPSLISKNPEIQKMLNEGGVISLDNEYRKIIEDINNIIPNKSISIEVYVDENTSVDIIVAEAIELSGWAPNGFIKIPLTSNGIIAARDLITKGININMTLNFNIEQAYALHLACDKLIKEYNTEMYISPFIGRLDDNGVDGLQTLINIQQLYKELDSNIQILAASIRSYEIIQSVVSNDIDIITIPAKFFTDELSKYLIKDENLIISQNININEFIAKQGTEWEKIHISHFLTESGITKFSNDWNKLLI